jgi:putative hemolysin
LSQKNKLGPLLFVTSKNNNPLYDRLIVMANSLAERLLLLNKIYNIYETIPSSSGPAEFIQDILNRFQISHSLHPRDLGAIPLSGPTVVVANHPFGGVDGLVLASILCSVRNDVKILVNYFIGRISEMRPIVIKVDPFGKKASINDNWIALKEAVRWVKKGGLLVVFPAGEVSHFRCKTRKIEDPEWNETIARIIRLTQAKVIPAYFKGSNSFAFQAAGLIHPLLRTLMLPREMLKKQSANINLKIGSTIPYKRMAEIADDSDLVDYLRFRTYLLGNTFEKTPGFLITQEKKPKSLKVLKPISAPQAPGDLMHEIDHFPDNQLLSVNRNLRVYMAYARQIPHVLQEIGRLREETFRKAGEGTGLSADLDRFDNHYIHIFVWDSETSKVIGAYRLAPTDEVTRRYGRNGLYTYTLFYYQRRLLNQLGPALEMSRSFVIPEYHKSYTPLLLLWKGIGQFVVRFPRYKILFGAVSITNEYKSYSRQLMTAFLKNNSFLTDLAEMVRPRRPFFQKSIPEFETRKAANWPEDIEELSSWISDIETDKKGVPILLKQYLKLGGKFISFNIDPSFGNVLDGLIMVDLTQTNPKILKRYMDPQGLAVFQEYHRDTYSEFPLPSELPAHANLTGN